jgi:SAM-dependent methyltransferase
MHYDQKYFEWQHFIGKLSGEVDLFKFKKYVNENDKIIDFGCGAGYILRNLNSKDKIGIEINPVAREAAKKNGITVYESIDEIQDEWATVIISHHALEHTYNPLDIVMKLKNKLCAGGKIIFVVPHERRNKFRKDDINQHLYTWSPMNLGNLFTIAGFKVLEVKTIYHRWPPFPRHIKMLFGTQVFHFFCKIYGHLARGMTQVRIVGVKE